MQRRARPRSGSRLHGRIPKGAPAPRSGARPEAPRSRMRDLIRASLDLDVYGMHPNQMHGPRALRRIAVMRGSLRSLKCLLTGKFVQTRWAVTAWCAVLASCAWSLAVAEQVPADQWKKVNVPIVRNYLLALKPSQVGTPLSGVQLSDGTFRLKGQTLSRKPFCPKARPACLQVRHDAGWPALRDPLPVGRQTVQGSGPQIIPCMLRRMAGAVRASRYQWRAV